MTPVCLSSWVEQGRTFFALFAGWHTAPRACRAFAAQDLGVFSEPDMYRILLVPVLFDGQAFGSASGAPLDGDPDPRYAHSAWEVDAASGSYMALTSTRLAATVLSIALELGRWLQVSAATTAEGIRPLLFCPSHATTRWPCFLNMLRRPCPAACALFGVHAPKLHPSPRCAIACLNPDGPLCRVVAWK